MRASARHDCSQNRNIDLLIFDNFSGSVLIKHHPMHCHKIDIFQPCDSTIFSDSTIFRQVWRVKTNSVVGGDGRYIYTWTYIITARSCSCLQNFILGREGRSVFKHKFITAFCCLLCPNRSTGRLDSLHYLAFRELPYSFQNRSRRKLKLWNRAVFSQDCLIAERFNTILLLTKTA